MANDIETLSLTTEDGLELESELCVPDGAWGAIVLAHPHPKFGGTMRSLVTSELFSALPGHGLSVLRFNFRGVEGSTGTYGGGRSERSDVVAAINALSQRSGSGPLITAGWSFGADVTLSVLDDRLAGWFVIAAPLRIFEEADYLAGSDPRPKCFATPERDEYRTPEAVHQFTIGWANTELHTVAGADHYLVGRTSAVVDLVVDFTQDLAGSQP